MTDDDRVVVQNLTTLGLLAVMMPVVFAICFGAIFAAFAPPKPPEVEWYITAKVPPIPYQTVIGFNYNYPRSPIRYVYRNDDNEYFVWTFPKTEELVANTIEAPMKWTFDPTAAH